MKKQVLLRWFWCLLEYLMVCPIIYIVAAFCMPGAAVIPITLVMPLHTLASIFIMSVLKKFRNLLAACIGILYTAGFSWLWITLFHVDITEGIIFTCALTIFFFVYGIRAGVSGSIRQYFYYSAGLVIHLISVFLTTQAPALMPFHNAGTALAIVYVIAGLPMANRRFLISETQEKSSLHIIPGSVLRGNKITLSILLVSIILLSFWRTLLDGIVFIVEKIAQIIGKILYWLTSFNESGDQPQGGNAEKMVLPPGEANPILSFIINLITGLFAAALLFFLLRYIIKHRKRIISAIFSWFSAIFGRFQKWSSTEQGYVDRQESLLKTDAPGMGNFFKKLFKREPKWKDMKDNTSRVRFLYTRFISDHIKKGFHFIPSETPDETIDRIQQRDKSDSSTYDDLRDTYKKVRYGDKQVDDGTVAALKDAYYK